MSVSHGDGDPFEVDLEDRVLLEELDLTTSLIAAANAAPGRLSSEEIDRVLGLR